ncbi:MAG TPA: NfeD family protein [Acidimicrobiia bacterium]
MPSDRSIVTELVAYWQEAGLDRSAIEEMRAELETHLEEAEKRGGRTDLVVSDLAGLAEQWAEARLGRRVPSWKDVQSGREKRRRETRRDSILYGFAVVALVSAAAVAGRGGANVDNEAWRWVWTIFALVMGIAEMFTAGFFLLPFAIGAAAAAILAWLDVNQITQWLVFFGVTAFAFAYLRRYVGRQDQEVQPAVGANRWIGAEGVVLETVDPLTGAGLVRVLSEEWRATSPGRIEVGTRIQVVDVSGTRLVVEPLEG